MSAKCPKCGKDIDSSDKTCPSCGTSVGQGFSNMPASVKLRNLSTVVVLMGSALVILDFLNVARTYVGTLVIGIGFILYAFSQRRKAREDASVEKKTLVLSFVFGGLVALVGIVFLVLDLIKA